MTAVAIRNRIIDSLADHRTPLIFNAWYVAGWTEEVSRKPLERLLLGRSVLLYRKEDGTPVALQNRCLHRSFPLSHGCLEGDSIRCGYHGLLFGPDGRLEAVPQQRAAPAGIGIQQYRVVERYPFIWIWMGDPAQADAGKVPSTPWLDSQDWSYARNYLEMDANYVGLHENLLDLTHFTYLHPTTLGTPEYASAPFEVSTEGDDVMISRFVPECDVPPMYTRTGIGGKMSRLAKSAFKGAGWHHASAVLTDLQADSVKRRQFNVSIDHFLTPMTQDSTHYWFTFARDFAVADPNVTEYINNGAMTAFNEDVFALQEIARLLRIETGSTHEINIRSDAAGVVARRALRRMAMAEQGADAMA